MKPEHEIRPRFVAEVKETDALNAAAKSASVDATAAPEDCDDGACCDQILSINHSAPIVICETSGAETRKPSLTPAPPARRPPLLGSAVYFFAASIVMTTVSSRNRPKNAALSGVLPSEMTTSFPFRFSKSSSPIAFRLALVISISDILKVR